MCDERANQQNSFAISWCTSMFCFYVIFIFFFLLRSLLYSLLLACFCCIVCCYSNVCYFYFIGFQCLNRFVFIAVCLCVSRTEVFVVVVGMFGVFVCCWADSSAGSMLIVVYMSVLCLVCLNVCARGASQLIIS